MRLKEKWTWYTLYRKVRKALKIGEKKGEQAMLTFLVKWLKEPSTVSAIITALGGVGLVLSDGIVQLGIGVVVALIVLYDGIRKERGKGRDK